MAKQNTVLTIDRPLMYKFFLGETTQKETDALAAWLDAGEEHQEEFNRAYELFLVSQVAIDGKARNGIEKTRVKRMSGFVKGVLTTLGVAASLLLGVVLNRYVNDSDSRGNLQIVSTLPGQRANVILADGTRVSLNSNSSIEYPSVFKGRNRSVKLSGEAFFDVVGDEKHPFVVKTYAYDVKVLGTEFDVLADEENGAFSTALIRGKVAVYDANSTVILTPDQKVTLEQGRLVKTRITNKDELRWPDGIISVGDMPFDVIIRRLSTSFGVNISVDMDQMPKVSYALLNLRISDGIDHALQMLQKRCDFDYTYDEPTDTYHILPHRR